MRRIKKVWEVEDVLEIFFIILGVGKFFIKSNFKTGFKFEWYIAIDFSVL